MAACNRQALWSRIQSPGTEVGTADKTPLRVDDRNNHCSLAKALARRLHPRPEAGLVDGSEGEIEAVLERDLYTKIRRTQPLGRAVCRALRSR